MTTGAAIEHAMTPLRDFMVRQTPEDDLALMLEVSGNAFPQSIEEISNGALIPAFVLSELMFVLIDGWNLVVRSLMSSFARFRSGVLHWMQPRASYGLRHTRVTRRRDRH